MEGISTMALLTFGYFDYDAFKNADLGMGSWRVVSTVVFWLTVILLVVVSQVGAAGLNPCKQALQLRASLNRMCCHASLFVKSTSPLGSVKAEC